MNNRPIVLITGGAGFIGSHLSNLLIKSGYKIRVLDPLSVQVHGHVPHDIEWLDTEDIEFIRESVCNRDAINKALQGVDSIVHLAAETGTGQSMYEIDRYYHVNCQGTALMFDILANDNNRSVKRIILASSRSVYGEGAYVCNNCSDIDRITPEPRTSDQLSNSIWEPLCPSCGKSLTLTPTKEIDSISPASIYASSKYAQEDIVRIGCSSLGIGYAILRLQNVYGEGQSLNNPYTGILSIFSTRVRRGLNLPIFEDGLESRDFIHVEDVAQTMYQCLALKNSPNNTFNVGSGIASSVLEVAEKLTRALGFNPDITITAQYRIGDIRHNVADIDRLLNELGYQPKITFDQGIEKFAQWVLKQTLPEDQLSKTFEEMKARKLMG